MMMKNNEIKISPTLRYGGDDTQNRVRGVKKHTYTEFINGLRRFLYSACICVGVFVLTYFVFNFVFQHVIVDGTSMNDTLENGDHLIVDRITYSFSRPKRSDIIVFKPYSDDPECLYIKRVIGVPGDTVQIKDGYVYVNDTKIQEDYLKDSITANPGIAIDKLTLSEDEYFVLGDNRQVSLDSRSVDVGLVSTNQIVGKGVADFWPANNFDVFIN